MKTFAHLVRLALGIGVIACFAGCASTYTERRVTRIQPARDFEVVETSARRPLTDREMAELRQTVARHLDQEGATDSGDYYLKVYLTPDETTVEPEWVVVRYTRYAATTVSVASTYGYPDASYPYSPYYSYDLYPYGYSHFGRISFQYYDHPQHGRRYYYPHRPRRDYDRDHNHGPGNRPPHVARPDRPRDRDDGPGRPGFSRPRPNQPDGRDRRPDRIAPDRTADRTPPAGTPSPPRFRPPPDRVPGTERSGERREFGRRDNAPQQQWRGGNREGSGDRAPRVAPPRTEARAPERAPESRGERNYSPPNRSPERSETRSPGGRRPEQP